MKGLQQGTRLVIGKNSAREVLSRSPERIISILSSKEPQIVLEDSRAKSHDWKKMDFDSISTLANSDSHQGVALIVKEKAKVVFKDKIKELGALAKARVLVLSSVQDPHHLGAIFRAAEAFGVDLLVWSTQHSTGITAAVTKVAVGATEFVAHCEVSNINDAVRKLKENNFWVIAADPGEGNQSLHKFEFPSHSAIVFGAEGEGIPRLTLELSDFKVAIEQKGKIDSLSLSQAAAVFLYESQRS